MDKATGKELLIDGKKITSEVTFIPEEPTGEVIVLFEFDARGNIYFRIEHSNNIILIYKDDMILPSSSDPEFEDYEWKEHIDKGICVPYKLTKRNIKLAFENILIDMNQNSE